VSGDPTPRAPRCTIAERNLRVLELQREIASGIEPARAARRLCASWGLLPRRSVRRYLSLAFASWSRDRKLSHAASLDVAIAVRRKLLRDAAAANDFNAALRAAEGIDELNGLGARSGLTVGEVRASLMPAIGEILVALRGEIRDSEQLSRIVQRVMAVLDGPATTNGAPVNRARPFLD
jgi:hypothetical protein